MAQVQVGDICVEIERKQIKNVHLSVHPPTGRVRISAPLHMSVDSIRLFAVGKLGWIRKHQDGFQSQQRIARREYIDRESHYVWGERYLLQVQESPGRSSVALTPRRIVLTVRPGTGLARKESLMAQWYRDHVREAASKIIDEWSPIVGVRVERIYVRKMKSKWGTCNHSARTIRLNTELALKPKDCLEYVVVHELVHLLEPSHNDRFVAQMNGFMPQWRSVRDRLNVLPIQYPAWGS